MGHAGQRGGIGMVAAAVHVATAPVAMMVAVEPAPVAVVVVGVQVPVVTGMMALAAAEALVAQVVLLRVVVATAAALVVS